MDSSGSIFLGDVPSEVIFANEEAESLQKDETMDEEFPQLTEKELEGIKETIHKLHVRSGHPTNQALVNCLKARGVAEPILSLAKEHKCDSCQEVRLAVPHNRTSLQKTETLWQTMQMDIGHLKVGETVVHFLLMIDEASHYMSACELFRHPAEESRN